LTGARVLLSCGSIYVLDFMIRIIITAAILPAALLACLPIFAQSNTAVNPAKPNVIVMIADDLGYQDVGCYSNVVKTPNIDRLAQTGVRSSTK